MHLWTPGGKFRGRRQEEGQVFPLGSRAGQTVGEELSSLLPEKKHTLLLPWEMGGRGVPRAPALSAQ